MCSKLCPLISEATAVVASLLITSCHRSESGPAPAPTASTRSGATPIQVVAPPAAVSRSPPVVEREIQLVKDGQCGWPSNHAPVLLEYRSYLRGDGIKYADMSFGLHIDADGSIWKFRYPSRTAPQCECGEILDAAAREMCLYLDSTLVARCSTELTAELKRSILGLAEPGLELRDPDEYGATLTLGAQASRAGKARTVGFCGSAQPAELRSSDAKVIIEVFRRARRIARLPPPCSTGEHRTPPGELAPGVASWTAP